MVLCVVAKDGDVKEQWIKVLENSIDKNAKQKVS